MPEVSESDSGGFLWLDTGSSAVTGAGPEDRQTRGLSRLTGGRPTQELAKSKVVSWLVSNRGHHIPAPTWEGCPPTLLTLLSCLAVPAGGCRSSGWALVLLAVVLLALVLLAGLWV